MCGRTLSKKSKNSSGDAPSPYFTPMLVRKVKTESPSVVCMDPLESTYIFMMMRTRSGGMFNSCRRASQSLALSIVSYAFCRST